MIDKFKALPKWGKITVVLLFLGIIGIIAENDDEENISTEDRQTASAQIVSLDNGDEDKSSIWDSLEIIDHRRGNRRSGELVFQEAVIVAGENFDRKELLEIHSYAVENIFPNLVSDDFISHRVFVDLGDGTVYGVWEDGTFHHSTLSGTSRISFANVPTIGRGFIDHEASTVEYTPYKSFWLPENPTVESLMEWATLNDVELEFNIAGTGEVVDPPSGAIISTLVPNDWIFEGDTVFVFLLMP